MRLAIVLSGALVMATAGCAAVTETHPIEQFAVVHAAIVPADGPKGAGGDAGECLLAVRYYAHRTDETSPGARPLERMLGLRPLDSISWIAPAFEADDAFRRAGWFCVSAPEFVATLGQDASIFVGESVRIPVEGRPEPRVERVGLETTARAEALDGGAIRLAVGANRMSLDDALERDHVRVSTSLDLPPGYSAILRLVPVPVDR